MKVRFFDTFSVVTLRIREPEKALFQEVVLLVPETEGYVEKAVSIGYSGYAVLAPTEDSGSCMVVGEVCVTS